MAVKWYQDNQGNTSSGRIMSMLALIGGLLAMFLSQVLDFTCDFDTALAALFAGALGGKAWQAHSEAKRAD